MMSAGYKSAYQQGYSDAMCDFRKKSNTDVLDKIRAEIQKLRNCSCNCSDGIIDDVEEILDKYNTESEK